MESIDRYGYVAARIMLAATLPLTGYDKLVDVENAAAAIVGMHMGDAAASAGQDTIDTVAIAVRSDGDDTIGAGAANRRPTITPPSDGTERLVAELRETAAFHAAVEALRVAVDQLDGEPGRDAAAAAWHAESVVRFFCSTYDGAVTGVRVNDDNFIVVSATVPGDDVTDVTIAVGPDGTCACKVSTADSRRASAAPDARAFEHVLKGRLAEVGVPGRQDGGRS